MMTTQEMSIQFKEQGMVFSQTTDDYDSYSIYHAGRRQSIIIRYSSKMDHYSTVVLPGHMTFTQFKNQYLQLSADTFSTNAFPSEESAMAFAKLLLGPE